MDNPTLADFFSSWELFRDPVLCGVAAGLVLGYLGVFIVLRRMVFVTATVSQSAGLGVALAFFAEIHLGMHVPPVAVALVLALLTAYIGSLRLSGKAVSQETILGLLYVTAAAATVLVGSKISQEAHDISAILFGTAVLVEPFDLALVIAVGALITVVHVFGHRAFLFASFDPEGARVHGLPVQAVDAVMWCLIAVEISVATRALGVVPVFAFALVPAVAGLLLARRVLASLVVGSLLGGLAGGLGYVIAFLFSFPVGASQAMTALALLLVVLPLVPLIRRKDAHA